MPLQQPTSSSLHAVSYPFILKKVNARLLRIFKVKMQILKRGFWSVYFLLILSSLSFSNPYFPPARTASYPNQTITLEMQNVEVREILRILAQKLNINLIIDKNADANLQKKVSVEIQNLPGDKAFESVLTASGLDMVKVNNNVLYVSTPENIKKMKPGKTLYYSLKYISPQEAVQILKDRPVQVSPLTHGNSVLLSGSPENVDEGASMLTEIDQATESVRVFHLNYADAAEVAQHLGTLFNIPVQTAGNRKPLVTSGTTTSAFSNSLGSSGSGLPGSSGPTGGFGGGYTGSSSYNSPSTPRPGQPFQQTRPGQPGQQQPIPGPQMTVEADETSNSVLVRANPSLLGQIATLVHQLDRKLAQVEVSVEILEVDSNKSKNLGIDWGSSVTTNLQESASPSSGPATATSPLVPAIPIHLSYRTPLQIQTTVNYLLEHDAAKILANTNVTTLDGNTGTILLGQQYPIVNQVSTQVVAGSSVTASNVQYVNIGTQFYFTPRIGENGDITLALHPEVSVIGSYTQAFGTQYPILNTRVADSSIVIKDGYTVVLGGLIDRELRTTKVKIPLLGEIPVLGDFLFASNQETATNTDLIFFITPKIITGKESVSPPVKPDPLKYDPKNY